MNRKMYISIPVVLILTPILAALLLAGWLILLVPVLVYPKIVGGFNPADKVTEVVTRRMMQSAMKGKPK